MSDRERGFIVIHRQIQSSPIFRSLSPEQRSVMLSILLLANWAPDRFMYGTEWVEVNRGELAHSLETIAAHAGVTVKVVRTTVAKLVAGQFLGTRAGTASGTGPRVLSVVNYNKYQDIQVVSGTAEGTPLGTAGAQRGHGTGTAGAPREPDQPDQPVTTLAPSPPVSPPSPVVVVVPCTGTGMQEYGVTDAQLDKWRTAFPGIDVVGEVRKAAAWCEANRNRRKTHAGVPRFLVSWLGRAQDRGGAASAASGMARRDSWTPAPGPPPDVAHPLFPEDV